MLVFAGHEGLAWTTHPSESGRMSLIWLSLHLKDALQSVSSSLKGRTRRAQRNLHGKIPSVKAGWPNILDPAFAPTSCAACPSRSSGVRCTYMHLQPDSKNLACISHRCIVWPQLVRRFIFGSSCSLAASLVIRKAIVMLLPGIPEFPPTPEHAPESPSHSFSEDNGSLFDA